MIEGNIRGKRIRSDNISSTHIKELKVFDLKLDDRLVGKCHYFTGRDYYPPWIELDYNPWPREEGLEIDLFRVIYERLPDGGRFFVTYYRDEDTLRGIMNGLSVADTPLGVSLLTSGFTWFKNWYFPEGGNEGGMKVQANKTLSRSERLRQLEELLAEVKTPNGKKIVTDLIAQG
ncbi:DUF1122 domain-containing protein [Metallosphaera tengchongensis]|uniref:DUF1122 domain-containing protein n=1 Tax=Metallosphaera tengchongensis TaxID=1532350 RepID=A0A6N0NSD1_9CREN|nr:DUF1122 family protein [Metallosphaera tengchongensis]QKQ99743.1 DUF1122 domain-containing protein [Metallosphaera tengchongensis]